ncbi:MAG: DNA-directed RNA polymerase subunit omega [Thiovulaceae bacterium]|nr:DNA-directed RNA polymerase subunit omega [Sulfurimonadaceae bacterium]
MRLEEINAKALKMVKDDRYILAMAVAKRAKEIEKGATSVLNIDPKAYKSADFALMEIAEGAVKVEGLVDK